MALFAVSILVISVTFTISAFCGRLSSVWLLHHRLRFASALTSNICIFTRHSAVMRLEWCGRARFARQQHGGRHSLVVIIFLMRLNLFVACLNWFRHRSCVRWLIYHFQCTHAHVHRLSFNEFSNIVFLHNTCTIKNGSDYSFSINFPAGRSTRLIYLASAIACRQELHCFMLPRAHLIANTFDSLNGRSFLSCHWLLFIHSHATSRPTISLFPLCKWPLSLHFGIAWLFVLHNSHILC